MPELPEVETVRRYLDTKLPGDRITAVTVDLPRLIKNRTEDAFRRTLTDRVFRAADRKGKYLILRLDGPESLMVHLRMTGRLVFQEDESLPDPPYTRIRFSLERGKLTYGDVRTLGDLWIIPSEGKTGISRYDTLGPDAIGDAFTPDYLYRKLKGTSRAVKVVILDQTVVAGVGNIYADEALFLAGIRPSRHADRVTKAESAKLCEAIRSVMLGSIEAGGTTFRDFLDGAGHEGGNVENLRVYGRDGEPCTVCGTEIQLTKIAGRGTRYCPKCQK